MGVDVAVFRVEKRGAPRRWVRRRVGSYHDEGDRLRVACEAARGLPMIERVDPYGSLVLTTEEMPQLADELLRLDLDPSAKASLRALVDLCGSEPDMELHLDGD